MRDVRRDDGGAIVEFLGVTLMVLVPLVYLITALAHVQAAAFAAEGAARAAARSAVTTTSAEVANGRSLPEAWTRATAAAHDVVALAADDFGADSASLELRCSSTCGAPGSRVTADVAVTVHLPAVPDVLARALPLDVTVNAEASSPVPGVAP